ncbi:YdcF family protein [Wenzhouxiangella sp. AB-CW3]|uniref:YdcF family protein n=1 Tax=Wenzhouxiangella sp. AB-CW3 TaxID=2771012 RepID=UPI00168AE7C8|nr:YdcF family protein [Wenzhouxiangella sp. AB-CW3]QOC24055.1 YdcF family protein [Wenzhouxiangella sp. AB-CW3]
MEIFLSKFIPLFLYPMGVLSSVLVLAAVLLFLGRVRAARAVVIVALVIAFGAGNSCVSHSLVRSLEREYESLPVEVVDKADVMIVLGGGLGLPYPPREYARLSTGSDRLLHALRLYQAGKAEHILLTGGNVFPQPGLEAESWYARELLMLWGVPDSAIHVEADSRNTLQNARFSANTMSEQGWERAILVTSATHMHRAVLTFRSVDIDVVPVATDFIATEGHDPAILGWVPTAEAMVGTTHALREYLGRLWYRVRLS